MDWSKVVFFKPEEFDSPDAPGSGAERMSPLLIQGLEEARRLARVPFKINSGYRTPDHNAAVGGKPKSAHLTGEGADIAARDPKTRFRILEALIRVGFVRIEVTPWHIHVDVARGDSHPQDILLVMDGSGRLV